MRRVLVTIAIAAMCAAHLAADVTVTLTTTVEGGLAAATGGGPTPKVVTRIHGGRSRTDVDLGNDTVSAIVDTATSQVYVLRHDQKTAQLFDQSAAGTPAPVSPGAGATPPAIPAPEITVKPTGQKRDINGVSCDEFSISIKMDMASMAASGSMPSEAVAMLKDVMVKLAGFTWIAKDAPGAAEYAAYQNGAAKLALAAIARGSAAGPGPGAAAPAMPAGMERLLTGFSEAPGIPYLTELTMTMEGSGQLVALLQQMGQMKLVSKVTEVSTEPVSEALLSVPEGYTVVKQ